MGKMASGFRTTRLLMPMVHRYTDGLAIISEEIYQEPMVDLSRHLRVPCRDITISFNNRLAPVTAGWQACFNGCFIDHFLVSCYIFP